jgi:CubicO group peptidase (beta-lactamase class C family)
MESLFRFARRSLAAALASSAFALVASAQAELVGTWDGVYEPPGVVGGDPFSLQIESGEGGRVLGMLVLPDGAVRLEGSFEPAQHTLRFGAEVGENRLEAELHLEGGALVGQARSGPWEWGFRAIRASEQVLERSHAPRVVALDSVERPETFSLVGLETEVGFGLDELIRTIATKNKVVGVSVACVVDGKLVDVRSLGWEDFFAEIPASDETRYRWASISKPLTATAALRLAARGEFDLDADIRKLVPEFPEKEVGDKAVTITPRHILTHQSGIVHYEGARRTWREYGQPYPFEELATGLDLFRSSPLLAAPGTLFSYSTHAWTLLGASMERAGKKRYAELVRALVLEPFAMKSTEPDYPSHAIPHRAKGYETRSDGTLVETFDDDVSWKLPGGGWISTVGDLARFGAGLIGTSVLDEEEKRAAWTPQKLADGKLTDQGLGIAVGEFEGQRLVSHSGGQRKASTFLAVLPERRLAVAAMCNTEGAPMGDLARGALHLLLALER